MKIAVPAALLFPSLVGALLGANAAAAADASPERLVAVEDGPTETAPPPPARYLDEDLQVFVGSTVGAPSPTDNPICPYVQDYCVNGCPSLWYSVVGTGGDITVSSCGTVNYDQVYHIFEGNSCSDLACYGNSISFDDGCGDSYGASQATWTSQNGTVYHVMVTGVGGAVGYYALFVTGATEPVLESTTCADRFPRTAAPTGAPAPKPTPPPTAPGATCSAGATTDWVYYSSASVKYATPAGTLRNGSAVCLAAPQYNVEVRPCNGTSTSEPSPAAVRVELVADRTGAAVQVRRDAAAPFTLFGEAPAGTTPPALLPDGSYTLSAKWAGANGGDTMSSVLHFTQSCPCPKSRKRKGMKGCMQMMARRRS